MSVRREEFGEETAATELVFRSPHERDRVVRARVGRPYQDAMSWACPVELAGYEARYADIRGEDSMQALVLALAFMWRMIETFVDLGGTVLHPDGHPYTLDELRAVMGR